MIRDEIIREAREWLGTPFRHQARLKHVGCDCIGLVWRVGEAVKVLEVDPVVVKRYVSYSRQPNPTKMREALMTFFVEIEAGEATVGDIAWLAWREDLPMHLAIRAHVGGRTTIIHALQQLGKVAEHGFTKEWVDRVDSWWRYPGLVY